MGRFLKKLAFIAALLILAPAVLCATAPRPGAPAGASRSLRGSEGIHCFCHKPAAGTAGTIQSSEAPAARIVYLPQALITGRHARPGALPHARPGVPALRPAPEPLLPPPIRTL